MAMTGLPTFAVPLTWFRNRGFAFLEFDTHSDAAIARRRLVATGVKVWGVNLAVDWAEPEPEFDDDIMNKVCVCVVHYH